MVNANPLESPRTSRATVGWSGAFFSVPSSTAEVIDADACRLTLWGEVPLTA